MKKTILRATGFLSAGLLISAILQANTPTFSYFTTQYQDVINVSTASAEDLIKHVEVIKKKDGSLVVEVVRDSDYGYRPDVGFSIEGDLAEYILHVNPIKAEINGTYSIPLEANVNAYQFLELLTMKFSEKETTVKGILKAKNYDGQVIATKDIELDIEYLLSRIDDKIVRNNPNLEQVDDPKALEDLTNLITFLAKGVNWEEESSEAVVQTIAPHLLERLESQRKQLDEKNNEKVKLLEEIEALKQQKVEPQTTLEKLEKVEDAQLEETKTKDEANEDVN
ncbi:hypothetical protein [Fredinandcohnia onubensis]|uniref:hypothetical protein n=1 Tax=Fredinandcohnia onubensis TaxID=1571209 RepID=UPI000C0C0888|nr:hypothetical protein [Fredinandcohnia onubensis]